MLLKGRGSLLEQPELAHACSYIGYQKSTSLAEFVGSVVGGAGSLERHAPLENNRINALIEGNISGWGRQADYLEERYTTNPEQYVAQVTESLHTYHSFAQHR